MALAASGILLFPDPMYSGSATVADIATGATVAGLTADTDKVAHVFQVPAIPASETITVVGFRIGAVTTARDLTVGIYTVDSSGNPTTTAYGGMAAGTVASASVSAGAWVEATLATACTPVAAGDLAAVVITGASGVNITLSYISITTTFPSLQRYTASAWSFKTGTPCIGIKLSGGTWPYIGTFPVSARSALTYNSGSAGTDEVGVVIPIPFKARCIGIWSATRTAAGSDYSAALYSGTTELASISIDGDLYPAIIGYRQYYFATPQTLTPGTTYYAAIKPTTTTSVLQYYVDVSSAAIMKALTGTTLVYGSNRVDAGAWSTTATRLPAIGLILDQLDDGASAGGGGAKIIGG